MNRVRITSRKLDGARRGIHPDEMVLKAGRAKAQIKTLVYGKTDADFRRPTKPPITKVDQELRKLISSARWLPKLKAGRR